jgi:serine/threonine protein kinase
VIHEHVVTIHAVEEANGVPFLVMEYIVGVSLEDRLQRTGHLRVEEVLRIGMQAASGLAAAHAQGLVHRDIKPANILFDGAGNAKLGDFGCAHLLDFGQTQTGGFIGTLAYLSPEQIGGGTIAAAADLYALGVTLFEALIGRPPFVGPDLVAQHLDEAPPSLAELRPGLAGVFDEVLARALAKSPEARFASAAAMAEAIRGWPTSEVPAPARNTSPEPVSPSELQPPRLLGCTRRGRLFVVIDPRVRRPVLREELDHALEPAEVAHVRALAGAGGPHVQRILALEPDLRAIIYEAIDGEETSFAALSPTERRTLDACWLRLTALGFDPAPECRVSRTVGGPVLLLVPEVTSPDYQPAKS